MQGIPPFFTGHIFGNMLIFGNTVFNLESVLIGIHIFGLACCLMFINKFPVFFGAFAFHYLGYKFLGFDSRKGCGNIWDCGAYGR